MATVSLRAITLLLCVNVVVTASADECPIHGLFLGDAPAGETNWSRRASGIAHDDAHWYITQTGGDVGEHAYIWRIPLTANLDQVDANSPGVLRITLTGGPGYEDPIGDPCVYRFGGVDYLLVPVNYHFNTVLRVFDAATLTLIDGQHIDADWPAHSCAVDPSGSMLTASWFWSIGGAIVRYTIDWPLLQQTGVLEVTRVGLQDLYAEDGVSDPNTGSAKGLEFTPDGRFLHLCAPGSIQAFDTATWARALRLSVTGSGDPEGLTVWDVETMPSWARGQLHVIAGSLDDDEVYFKHYTRSIRVRAGAEPPGDGRPGSEFASVTAAAHAAWPGSEIRIFHGNFDEALAIDKRVRLKSVGGTTRIGG